MKRLVILAALLWATSEAQDYQQLANSQDVARRIGGVRTQLIYVTPVVEDEVIAEAIRRAAVERGVKVFLLLTPELVEAPGSYAASLATLEGVQIRLAQVDRSFAILDVEEASVVLEGSLLGSGSATFREQTSYAMTEGQVVSDRSALFGSVWDGAIPYVSLVERIQSPEQETETFDWSVLGGL